MIEIAGRIDPSAHLLRAEHGRQWLAGFGKWTVPPLGSTFGLCTSVPPAFQSWYASWMVWPLTLNSTCQRPAMDELPGVLRMTESPVHSRCVDR